MVAGFTKMVAGSPGLARHWYVIGSEFYEQAQSERLADFTKTLKAQNGAIQEFDSAL